MEPCTAKRRKSMDKSCRVYGNFYTGNHGMIAGRRAYIAVQNGRWIVFKRARGTKREEFSDGKTAVVPRCKVRFLTYPFQRTAISGNSFTYSQKFCEWHTLVFESQAQNRVHVETASISLRQPSSALPEGGI